jgi:hypothetical protein
MCVYPFHSIVFAFSIKDGIGGYILKHYTTEIFHKCFSYCIFNFILALNCYIINTFSSKNKIKWLLNLMSEMNKHVYNKVISIKQSVKHITGLC